MRYLNYLLLAVFVLLSIQCSEDSYDNEIYSLNDYQYEEQLGPVKSYLKNNSNEKNEKWEQDFATIKEEILSRNKNKKFLERLIRLVGHPNWDEAFSASESGDDFPYYIPFLKPNDSRTNAVLMVTRHKNDKKLNFKLIEREPFIELLQKIKPKKITSQHIIFSSIFKYFDAQIYQFEEDFLRDWIEENKPHVSNSRTKSFKNCDRYQVCYTVFNFSADGCPANPTNVQCGISVECFWHTDCSNEPLGGDIDGGRYDGGGYGDRSGGSSGSSGGTCYTCDVDANYPQDSDPSAAYANLNESELNRLMIEGFSEDEWAVIDKLKKFINDAISSINFTWPQSEEEWENFAELLKNELETLLDPETLADLIIPGLGDIKSSIKNFHNGSYYSAGFDLAMAVVDLVPGKKAGKIALGIGNKIRRSSVVLSLYRNVRSALPSNVWTGFKGTIRGNYKNPGKIFSTHHLANQKFTQLLNKFGGQQEFIAEAYKNAHNQGHFAGMTFGAPKYFNFKIDGINLRGSAIKLSDGAIRFDDFWVID